MEKNQIKLSKVQLQELEPILSLVIKKYDPECIICFGVITRINLGSGCFMDDHNTCSHHYFVLLITKSATRIEHQLQEYVNQIFKIGIMTVISHGKKIVDNAIRNNDRFFSTIYRQGYWLFNSDNLSSQNNLTDTNAINDFSLISLSHELHYEIALGFLEGAETFENEDRHYNRLFFLNQAFEQLCSTVIFVHTGYRSGMHNLDKLLKFCCCIHPEFASYFPNNTTEEIRLFRVLNISYAKGRYGNGFEFTPYDVITLSERVHEFLRAVIDSCERKLEELKQRSTDTVILNTIIAPQAKSQN
jgi:hypothetical protein